MTIIYPPPADQLFFVAGPCGMESLQMMLETAHFLAEEARILQRTVIFKASFDKANRTRGDAWRGPGLQQGLEWLAEVRQQTGLWVLTDVHEPSQCAEAATVADVLQIPAFLCRQTDLIQSASATGRIVNIKRGQFLDPKRTLYLLQKSGSQTWLTERGSCFGYGDLVFDPRSLIWMKATGATVLFDCTHSLQTPTGGETGGTRSFCAPLARAAAAVGIDGLYAELHPSPQNAKSDSATQLSFQEFDRIAHQVIAIDEKRRELAP